ncbi:MAG TPA: ATP-binding protein [Solirubrobacteraceae bacterium]|jgi:serine/threonine-protein kinase RsbW/stage II sporulation protein AB (anti-sigma F factor)
MEVRRGAALRPRARSTAERLVRSWPAVAQSVAAARRAAVEVATRLGATPAALAAVELAVSEAVTNAVQHAYVDRDAPGSVTLTVEPAAAGLRVVVADDGVGMRPRPDSRGLGLGLPLIAQITHSFEVRQPTGGGTVLAMRFDLQRGHL